MVSTSPRLATTEDYQAIYLANNKSNPKENSAWLPPMIREDIDRQFVLFDPETHGFIDFYPTKREPRHVTVYNIFVPKDRRGVGAGKRLMLKLRELYPDVPITLKCPVGIPSNEFYSHLGLRLEKVLPPEGRRLQSLNVWVWDVSPQV